MVDLVVPDGEIAQSIRLVLSDVDGVLTDGAIVIDDMGRESKSFHVRDGLGITLWQRRGFHFGIVTARSSRVVARRAAELGISFVRQGAVDKLAVAREIMDQIGVAPEETCYIGDDLPDLEVMAAVGLAATVADAATDVRQASRWVMDCNGGRGAVRELLERLLRAKGCWDACLPRRAAE